MTDTPTEPAAPAKKSSDMGGCLYIVAALVALIVGGLLWNAIFGSSNPHAKSVSRSDYLVTWPLTVDSAKIGCADGRIPYVEVGDTRYALDGTERYAPIDPIWAPDPATPGLRLSIARLRADALQLC